MAATNWIHSRSESSNTDLLTRLQLRVPFGSCWRRMDATSSPSLVLSWADATHARTRMPQTAKVPCTLSFVIKHPRMPLTVLLRWTGVHDSRLRDAHAENLRGVHQGDSNPQRFRLLPLMNSRAQRSVESLATYHVLLNVVPGRTCQRKRGGSAMQSLH